MQCLVLFLCTIIYISNKPVTNVNYRGEKKNIHIATTHSLIVTSLLALQGLEIWQWCLVLMSSQLGGLGKVGAECIIMPFISADHSASLRFIPPGILTNKHSFQADTVPSQHNESCDSNVSTAGIKAHGGIAQSEASRQLIFPLWLAKLCCSYTNGNGMCMSVPLSLPSLSLSLPSVKTIAFNL